MTQSVVEEGLATVTIERHYNKFRRSPTFSTTPHNEAQCHESLYAHSVMAGDHNKPYITDCAQYYVGGPQQIECLIIAMIIFMMVSYLLISYYTESKLVSTIISQSQAI